MDTRYLRNVPDAPRVQGEILGWDRGSIGGGTGTGGGGGGATGFGRGVGSSSNIAAAGNVLSSSKQRSSSDEFSPPRMTNGISEPSGKYDFDNVDVEIREDELRIEDDFEMDEDESVTTTNENENGGQQQKEGNVGEGEEVQEVKVNGNAYGGDEEESEPDLRASSPIKAPSSAVKSQLSKTSASGGLTSSAAITTARAAASAAADRDDTPWPMNETVELINEPSAAANETIEMVNEAITTTTGSAAARMSEEIVNEAVQEMNETVEMINEEIVGGEENLAPKSAIEQVIPLSGENEAELNDADIEAALEVAGEPEEEEEERSDETETEEGAEPAPPPPYELEEKVTSAGRRSAGGAVTGYTGVAAAMSAAAAGTDFTPPDGVEEDEIDSALRRRDMETLVEKILEGQGTLLLNRRTSHPDVQEFLNNVPAYMTKINAIHTAASIGSLRDLQALLDRKRLALARDEFGRGPLHKAVLNNHVHIAKHLANNFPQVKNVF